MEAPEELASATRAYGWIVRPESGEKKSRVKIGSGPTIVCKAPDGTHTFTLDGVMNEKKTLAYVFQMLGIAVVDAALGGFNCTMLVVGSPVPCSLVLFGADSDTGFVDQAVLDAFQEISVNESIAEATIKVSCLEISPSAAMRDLLVADEDDVVPIRPVEAMDMFDKPTVRIEGLPGEFIDSEEQASQVLRLALANRSSHESDVVVSFEFKVALESGESLSSHLRFAMVGNTGSNSWKHYAHCVSEMAQARAAPLDKHPLTAVLRDSLGGNSHTVVLGICENNRPDVAAATLGVLEHSRQCINHAYVNKVPSTPLLIERLKTVQQQATKAEGDRLRLQAQLETQESRVGSLQQDKQRDKEKRVLLERQLERLERENAELKESVSESSTVEAQQKQHLKRISELEQARESLNQRIESLERTLRTVERDLAAATANVERLTAERAEFQASSTAFEKQASTLQSSLTAEQGTAEELGRQLEDKTEAVTRLEEVITSLTEANTDLETAATAASSSIAALTEKNKALEKKQAAATPASASDAGAAPAAAAAADDSAALQAQLRDLEAKLAALEEENRQLRQAAPASAAGSATRAAANRPDSITVPSSSSGSSGAAELASPGPPSRTASAPPAADSRGSSSSAGGASSSTGSTASASDADDETDEPSPWATKVAKPVGRRVRSNTFKARQKAARTLVKDPESQQLELLQGKLQKKGNWGVWSERYFVLQPTALVYFDHPKDMHDGEQPRGVIPLDGSSRILWSASPAVRENHLTGDCSVPVSKKDLVLQLHFSVPSDKSSGGRGIQSLMEMPKSFTKGLSSPVDFRGSSVALCETWSQAIAAVIANLELAQPDGTGSSGGLTPRSPRGSTHRLSRSSTSSSIDSPRLAPTDGRPPPPRGRSPVHARRSTANPPTPSSSSGGPPPVSLASPSRGSDSPGSGGGGSGSNLRMARSPTSGSTGAGGSADLLRAASPGPRSRGHSPGRTGPQGPSASTGIVHRPQRRKPQHHQLAQGPTTPSIGRQVGGMRYIPAGRRGPSAAGGAPDAPKNMSKKLNKNLAKFNTLQREALKKKFGSLFSGPPKPQGA